MKPKVDAVDQQPYVEKFIVNLFHLPSNTFFTVFEHATISPIVPNASLIHFHISSYCPTSFLLLPLPFQTSTTYPLSLKQLISPSYLIIFSPQGLILDTLLFSELRFQAVPKGLLKFHRFL